MAGAYSQDLPDRVIDAVENVGMSRRAASLHRLPSQREAGKTLEVPV